MCTPTEYIAWIQADHGALDVEVIRAEYVVLNAKVQQAVINTLSAPQMQESILRMKEIKRRLNVYGEFYPQMPTDPQEDITDYPWCPISLKNEKLKKDKVLWDLYIQEEDARKRLSGEWYAFEIRRIPQCTQDLLQAGKDPKTDIALRLYKRTRNYLYKTLVEMKFFKKDPIYEENLWVEDGVSDPYLDPFASKPGCYQYEITKTNPIKK